MSYIRDYQDYQTSEQHCTFYCIFRKNTAKSSLYSKLATLM